MAGMRRRDGSKARDRYASPDQRSPHHGISPLRARRARAGSRRILVEPLEDRRLLTTIVALSEANELLRVDSLRPTTILDRRAITGLQAGETVLGIDARPKTGELYALGSTGRLYVV